MLNAVNWRRNWGSAASGGAPSVIPTVPLLIAAKAQPEVQKTLMRHAQLATTDEYGDPSMEQRRKASPRPPGKTKELSTMQAVKKAADGYRLTANRESDAVSRVTMSAVLDRYERELIEPSIDVPLGGLDDGRISSLTARAYRSYLKRWISRDGANTSSAIWQSLSCARLLNHGWMNSVAQASSHPNRSGVLGPCCGSSSARALNGATYKAIPWNMWTCRTAPA
jgi:hypothetical protein